MSIIPTQSKLDNKIPVIHGNADYRRNLAELTAIDEIIKKSGLEDEVILYWFKIAQEEKNARRLERGLKLKKLTHKEKTNIQERAIQAFRVAILRKLEKKSFRKFCKEVARAPLLQWFCRINQFDKIKVFSKSTVENYEKDIPLELIKKLETHLIKSAASVDIDGRNTLGLENPISLENCYIDTTCIKVNIHFPVDWVLLRDAVRTLMLAVNLIRRSGLKNRMPGPPEEFIRKINKLSIDMTHSRRKQDGRRVRRKVLRQMKRFVKVVRKHAERHYRLLDERWEETDWTRKEAEQILNRISRIIEKLPEAQRQAHERIIGGRRVANKEKILSLYEDDVNVIVRGKAGAEVEFGNTLLVVEQADGLVVDWRLFKDQAPADSQLLQASLERIDGILVKGHVGLVSTDRGFDSKPNRGYLAGEGIYNAMCPRSPHDLKERMDESRFRAAQKRRGQTEGRISIAKRCFTGNPMLQKGFDHRDQHMGLSILAHNLWVLARKIIAEEKSRKLDRALPLRKTA